MEVNMHPRRIPRALSVGFLFFSCLGTLLVQMSPAERVKAQNFWAGDVHYSDKNEEVCLSVLNEGTSGQFACRINGDDCILSYPSGGGNDEFNITPYHLNVFLVGHVNADETINGTWQEKEGDRAGEYSYQLTPSTSCTLPH
jgi:hypothetical protein